MGRDTGGFDDNLVIGDFSQIIGAVFLISGVYLQLGKFTFQEIESALALAAETEDENFVGAFDLIKNWHKFFEGYLEIEVVFWGHRPSERETL